MGALQAIVPPAQSMRRVVLNDEDVVFAYMLWAPLGIGVERAKMARMATNNLH